MATRPLEARSLIDGFLPNRTELRAACQGSAKERNGCRAADEGTTGANTNLLRLKQIRVHPRCNNRREGLLAPDRIKPLHTFPASKGPNGWTPDKELCVLSAMIIETESVELPKAESPVVAEMIWSRECPVCLKTLVKKHLSQVLHCVCGWEWGA